MRAREGRRVNRSLVFNLGFVDEHNGDVVAYGIYPVALGTLESLAIMDEVQFGLTQRTNKDF
jgi:hypothetical protein